MPIKDSGEGEPTEPIRSDDHIVLHLGAQTLQFARAPSDSGHARQRRGRVHRNRRAPSFALSPPLADAAGDVRAAVAAAAAVQRRLLQPRAQQRHLPGADPDSISRVPLQILLIFSKNKNISEKNLRL